MTGFTIRPEQPGDLAAIRAVNASAFGRSAEADAIEALRQRGQAVISLVAVQDEIVVGHLLFSPVILAAASGAFPGLGLAPLAVSPGFQRCGIGTQLTQTGIDACRKIGCEFVAVLGDPRYYSRFGFERASRYGLRCEWDVPLDAFQVLALRPGVLDDHTGVIKYQPEWDGV